MIGCPGAVGIRGPRHGVISRTLRRPAVIHAPEHKFPAGIDSNMAAVTALRVRDEGGPVLCGQLLLYPVTDYYTPGTPSYRGEF